MKKLFLKPIATLAVVAITMFSCASTNDSNTAMNDDTQGAETEGTTTGTAGTDTDDTTYGTTTDTQTDTDVATDTQTGTTTTGTTTDTQTQTEGTTGTTYGTTDDMSNTTGTVTTDNMSSTNMEYGEMFNDIDNTEQYGVLELARMNPNLSTFVTLVEQAGLTSAFEVEGPVTVFAPTNEAFEALSKERYDSLMNPQNSAMLTELLNLHIMNSEIPTAQFNSRQFIDREQGDDINITTGMDGNIVYVGGAQIVRPDVEASNGVLHVVNGIIETSPDAGPGPGMD